MMQNKKTMKVAVTGGIGSGKSTAIKILADEGYFTLSCDEISREVSQKRTVLRKIRKLFPQTVSGVFNLELDRKKLADEVFNDKEKLGKLNAILHPAIMDEAIKRADHSGATRAFIEVPLLFESRYANAFDKVIVVKRDKTSRIESVKFRSGLSEEEILARMDNQIDYDNFDFSAYTVVQNDTTVDDLRSKVLDLVKKSV